jgi:uncharacterized membrane protein
MGFFNPALLWFALGGLIPIIIHLLHRQKFKRVRWAAMEFLLAALRKTRRRMQIENLLLLLLRILVVLLLALAVARPFFHEAPLGALEESDTHHVFVLDVSASMGYKRAQNTSLDVAKRAAEKVLQDLRPSEQDRFTLVTLSTYPEAVLKDRNRPQQLKDALAEMKPTDYGTSVYRTMQAVATVIREAKNRDKRVYLFTDLQAGGWVLRDEAETRKFQELLKELSQRPDTRFYLYDAGTSDAFNAAVVDLRVGDPVVTTKRKTRFSAVLHNFSSTPRTSANVHLHVNDSLVRTLPAVLPARASTEVTFEHDFTEAAPHFVKVSLDPDYLDADDHRYLALDVKTALRCLFIDGEPGDSPRSSEVFAPVLALDPSRQGLFFSVDVKTLPLFNAEGLDAYDFVALCNVQSLTSDKIEKLEQFVRRGGGLFVSLGDQVDKVSFNEHFWKGGKGLSPASLDEVTGTAPEGQLERGVERRIAKFHAGHPVFRQFQKRTMAALYGLVFYKYYKTKDLADPNAVLASLNDNFGSPFLLERTFEEGKVLLWTSTVDDEWNAGIQAYPPFFVLMWEMGLHLSARPGHQRNLFLGDLVRQTLPVELYQPPFLLETPQDGVVTLSAAAPAEDQKIFELYYPGRSKADDPKVLRNEGLRNVGKYRLTRSPAREEPKLVSYYAVNMPPRAASPEEIDAAEGNLERISREDIKVRYPDFKVEFRGEKKSGEAEMEVKAPASGLWKWLLYLVAGFMLAESVLACLFGRGKQ